MCYEQKAQRSARVRDREACERARRGRGRVRLYIEQTMSKVIFLWGNQMKMPPPLYRGYPAPRS